ncbi:MAG: DUF934 domain-containing protein [Burkholderiales bacterium]
MSNHASTLVRLTKSGASVSQEEWSVLTLAQFAEGSLDTHCAAPQKRLLPLTVWLEERDALIADATHPIGVWLDSHEDPAAIAEDLPSLAVVGVNFPSFKDGRGYSTAYLLRQRYGYTGELRALGDVQRDQLFYMKRVGFDAFQLKAGASIEDALTAFNDFTVSYQGSIDQPLPYYRQRLAQPAPGGTE